MSSFKKSQKSPMSGTANRVNDKILPALDISKVSGVKPSVSTGLGIVSSGNKQLDELIGGGISLGTLTLVENDNFSTYGDTLLLYGLSESVSHAHTTLLVCSDSPTSDHWLNSIPYNQTVGGKEGQADDYIGPPADNKDVENGSSSSSTQLSIAWQYEKYIKQQNQKQIGASDNERDASKLRKPTYCCSYDLSRRLQPSILTAHSTFFAILPRGSTDTGSDGKTHTGTIEGASTGAPQVVATFRGHPYWKSLLEAIHLRIFTYCMNKKNSTMSSGVNDKPASNNVINANSSESGFSSNSCHNSSVGSVFIPNLEQMMLQFIEDDDDDEEEEGGGVAEDQHTRRLQRVNSLSREVLGFLLQLKHLIRYLRVRVTVSVHNGALDACLSAQLRNLSDTVLTIQSFAGRTQSVPYEFETFQGFLLLRKIAQYGTVAPFRASGIRFGLKRDRRKLHVEPLHLPPEESRAFGSAGTAADALQSNRPNNNSSGNDGNVEQQPQSIGVAIHHKSNGNTSNKVLNKTAAEEILQNTEPAANGSSSATTGRGASSDQSTAGSTTTSSRYTTPLAASIAALKAARSSSSTGSTAGGTASGSGANNTAVHLPKPISIHSSTLKGGSAVARDIVTVASSNITTASKLSQSPSSSSISANTTGTGSGSGSDSTTTTTTTNNNNSASKHAAPLEPGQACGSGHGSKGSQKYDF
mmetsp:Transcript_23499/g.39293  ORF Transcript_23499/g.39293 Transcript_23499/m.39293 type:complete len:698 (+) Transcript_23499:55-2148(+)